MKTWFITGCSSGIGRGIAKAVLENGDRAVVTARNIDSVQDIMNDYPNTALALTLDITKNESITLAVEKALDVFGRIDVLVNNAGYGYRSSVEEGNVDDVKVLFDTNFFGPVELIKTVLPSMRQNKYGFILNVSSIAGVRSAVGSGYYAASKAALELMSDGLSKEVKPLGIEVMIVEPGAFRTRFYDTSLKGTDKKIEDYTETAGKTRKENVVNLENQPGDPDKAGKVLVEMVEKGQLPLRLLLGSDAVKLIETELENRLVELRNNKPMSILTDYEK
jgi:NAD(P)-dependent dehydrogenase (short-subunit alcohol dehydrogenase family)